MDRLTLLSMQGGLLVFLGIVSFMAWHAHKRPSSDNGPVWFALGYVVGGLGLFLEAYRGIIPALYAIILGNSLFLMTYVFMEKAIAVTTRRRSLMYWQLSVVTALILSFVYFTYVKPDVMIRTIEAVIVIPILQFPIWLHVVRCKEDTIKPALRALSAVLLVHMLMNFIRIVAVIVLRQPDVWSSWVGVITVAGICLSFMWIDSLRLRDELERLAMTDPLTGLLNRRALDEFGARELSRSIRKHLPCSALAIDLNLFKEINDTYGHAAGDLALCAVANALRSTLRITDLATRTGGDEFFVLLPESDEQGAEDVAERVRFAIQDARVETAAGRKFSIGVSIGRTTSRGPGMTVAELFHDSDVSLYQEKQAGRVREIKSAGAVLAYSYLSEQGEVLGINPSNA